MKLNNCLSRNLEEVVVKDGDVITIQDWRGDPPFEIRRAVSVNLSLLVNGQEVLRGNPLVIRVMEEVKPSATREWPENVTVAAKKLIDAWADGQSTAEALKKLMWEAKVGECKKFGQLISFSGQSVKRWLDGSTRMSQAAIDRIRIVFGT